MGICRESVESCYRDLYNGYLSDVFNLEKSTVDDITVRRQISVDVKRTFASARVPQFTAEIESQQNSLFNLLAVYAKHCPEIGYCQGMNYLAGLILIGVNFDEVSAFVIFETLLGNYA